jgi:hypothetical protein
MITTQPTRSSKDESRKTPKWFNPAPSNELQVASRS